MNQLTKSSSSEEIKMYFNAILRLAKASEEFPVNLEEVWPLVYSRKQEAVRALTNEASEFIENVDYKAVRQNAQRSEGGQFTGGGTDYYLSVSCLEFFIARKVRPVFEVYRQVFLEFARWLSPAFAIWCNDRIKELLKTGVSTVSNDGKAILYAMQVLNRRLEEYKIKKIAIMFADIKNIAIFAMLTDSDCIHFAGQAVNLLISYMGYFYARNLRYWRLYIRRYYSLSKWISLSVSSVYGNRFFVAYYISLNAYRYE